MIRNINENKFSTHFLEHYIQKQFPVAVFTISCQCYRFFTTVKYLFSSLIKNKIVLLEVFNDLQWIVLAKVNIGPLCSINSIVMPVWLVVRGKCCALACQYSWNWFLHCLIGMVFKLWDKDLLQSSLNNQWTEFRLQLWQLIWI